MQPATNNTVHLTLRAAATIGWYSAVFGAALVVAMVVSAFGTIDNAYLLVFTKLAALFATLGALYGAIIALDPRAPRVLAPWNWIQQVEARTARTLVCTALGTLAVWVISTFTPSSFGQTWLLLGALAGAVLGWFGWRWAKYVDF